MCPQDDYDTGASTISRGRYSRASCCVRSRASGELSESVIDFDDIDGASGMRLEKPDSTESLNFVLRRTGFEDLVLQVRWDDWID